MLLIKPEVGHNAGGAADDDHEEAFSTVNGVLYLIRWTENPSGFWPLLKLKLKFIKVKPK